MQKNIKKSFSVLILCCLFAFAGQKEYVGFAQQLDTLLIPELTSLPHIDGDGSDPCWENIPWQQLYFVWIPYGVPQDSHSFTAAYKVCWSSKTQLLYFLIIVKDDVFIDGYTPGREPEIYNFDIAEVFIDEDASGGLHVFDGIADTSTEWGTNAENAFTYHIYAPFPKSDTVTRWCIAEDLAGTSWSTVQHVNYVSHFPDFALAKNGSVAVWEFSLSVFDSTYDHTQMVNARASLKAGKTIGLSVAYCDNDAMDGVRDAMFGSDWEPAPGNFHWMNADYFRKARLVASPHYEKKKE